METSWARSLGGLNHPSTKEVRENISASTGNDLAGGIFFSHLHMLKYRFLFRINPVFKQVYLLTESYILSPYSVAWQAVHMQNVYKLDGYFFFFFFHKLFIHSASWWINLVIFTEGLHHWEGI